MCVVDGHDPLEHLVNFLLHAIKKFQWIITFMDLRFCFSFSIWVRVVSSWDSWSLRFFLASLKSTRDTFLPCTSTTEFACYAPSLTFNECGTWLLCEASTKRPVLVVELELCTSCTYYCCRTVWGVVVRLKSGLVAFEVNLNWQFKWMSFTTHGIGAWGFPRRL
jgi:hypothetical protein